VGRITVEAFRLANGVPQAAGSAASDTDGTWKLDNVLAGSYRLRFSSPGFVDAWFPGVSTESGAGMVVVHAVTEASALDMVMTGQPGTVSGVVMVPAQRPTPATVTVRPVVDDVVGDVVATTTADAQGAFAVAGLATPASYEVTFSAPGFESRKVRADLVGGESEIVNTVHIGAGLGSIAGTALDSNGPLGGVVVTVRGAGFTASATTPTSGQVGRWTVPAVPTPGLYVVTFALPGYATETVSLDLAAGEHRSDVEATLRVSVGTVTGRVLDGAGHPLGGVSIVDSGGSVAAGTTTLTDGDVGAFLLGGLAAPGRYTLTFTLDGYTTVARAVDLGSSGVATGVDATLVRSTGAITGRVTSGGRPVLGATVVAGDGASARSTGTTEEPPGAYLLGSLPPGMYTLTVSAPGLPSKTLLVRVVAGETTRLDVALGGAAT
jgi:hypothetical protein